MTQEWLNQRLVREHVDELQRQLSSRPRRSLRTPRRRRYTA
jgi:hypothetical protein